MKRKFMVVALSLALGLTSMQGCIGSFGLTGKVYDFNKSFSNKWVKEVIFILLIFPYGVTLFIDAIVLNSIEFWTGSNPVAMQPGDREVQYVKGEKGLYKIEATKNRFHIAQVEGPNAGEYVDLVYNPQTDTWSLGVENRMRKIVQFSADSSEARVFKPDGKVVTVKTGSSPDEIYKALGL